MATTKVLTEVRNAVVMTAGAGDVNSSSVDMSTAYGGAISLKLTNGATGPTLPGQIQIETSHDDSEWFPMGGPFVGSVANSAVVATGPIDIPIGVEFIRVVTGSNTGQNVTAEVHVSIVTVIDA